MSRQYGYARVSTDSQNIEPQVIALEASGVDAVFSEKITGATMKDRRELETLLRVLQKGDTLVVTKLDRLARSVFDLQKIVIDLKERGAFLTALDQPVDTSSAAGKAFLDMLGVFAEFELNLRKERQAIGIEHAKQKGVYKGRVPTAQRKAGDVIRLSREGYKVSEVVKELQVSRASVYRILKANSSS